MRKLNLEATKSCLPEKSLRMGVFEILLPESRDSSSNYFLIIKSQNGLGWRKLKDHLLPTPLPWEGQLSSR